MDWSQLLLVNKMSSLVVISNLLKFLTHLNILCVLRLKWELNFKFLFILVKLSKDMHVELKFELLTEMCSQWLIYGGNNIVAIHPVYKYAPNTISSISTIPYLHTKNTFQGVNLASS